MSQSHIIKGGATDEVFEAIQEQCFLWERGASVDVDFLTVKNFYKQNNLYKTMNDEKKQNNNRSPLNYIFTFTQVHSTTIMLRLLHPL